MKRYVGAFKRNILSHKYYWVAKLMPWVWLDKCIKTSLVFSCKASTRTHFRPPKPLDPPPPLLTGHGDSSHSRHLRNWQDAIKAKVCGGNASALAVGNAVHHEPPTTTWLNIWCRSSSLEVKSRTWAPSRPVRPAIRFPALTTIACS